ncbi:hypothetical protein [Streptomyces beigongshangae]|uniref:hypothetical protein n=1 Tax=Streptomyces beigongshangae TaxID=2841597 RepID=UPI001C861FE3|nr:hypothetical protein [Streptomyces sp. REN17]
MGHTVLLVLLPIAALVAAAVVVARRRRSHAMSGPGPGARVRAGADRSAARSLTDATTCLCTARGELATARTPVQYAQVTRTATQGLRHIRRARTVLGLDPGPFLPEEGDRRCGCDSLNRPDRAQMS